jgi:hypothetical protein
MVHAFDDVIDNPINLTTFIIEGIIFSLVGIAGGTIIDSIFVKLSRQLKSKHHKLALVFAQIVFSVGLMYLIFVLTKEIKFAEYWQTTIPGLAFPAFYFGIQSNIYTTLQSYYL